MKTFFFIGSLCAVGYFFTGTTGNQSFDAGQRPYLQHVQQRH